MKNTFQTAAEKMTDTEVAAWHRFITDRSKGQAARLLVIEGALESQMKQRGMLPPRKSVSLQDMAAVNRMAKADLKAAADFAAFIEGEKNVMPKHDSKAFKGTLRACFGVNDFFGDDATEAARNLDADFFRDALAAIEFLKAKRARRKPTGGKSKMMLHVKAALRILSERNEPLAGMKKAELRKLLEDTLGDDAFTDEKSWTDLYARREIKGFVREQEHSGGRPRTSGKGRAWFEE